MKVVWSWALGILMLVMEATDSVGRWGGRRGLALLLLLLFLPIRGEDSSTPSVTSRAMSAVILTGVASQTGRRDCSQRGGPWGC